MIRLAGGGLPDRLHDGADWSHADLLKGLISSSANDRASARQVVPHKDHDWVEDEPALRTQRRAGCRLTARVEGAGGARDIRNTSR